MVIRKYPKFFQDHVSVLPPDAFNYASELRANAEFARSVLTTAAEFQDSPEKLFAVQLRFFAANSDGSNEIHRSVGLQQLGSFLTYTVLPTCKALGVGEMPPEIPARLQKIYFSETDDEQASDDKSQL